MACFFITGLPRSRTAWLSAVCDSVPGAVCFHEPLRFMQKWQDCGSWWTRPHVAEHVGISDSGLGLHLTEILEGLQPRTVIIERAIDDVVASLVAKGLPVSLKALAVLQRRLDAAEDNPLVKTVRYEDLSRTDVVVSLLRHMMPGALFDFDRIDRMQGMNIQADPGLAMAAAVGAGIIGLFGADAVDEMRA